MKGIRGSHLRTGARFLAPVLVILLIPGILHAQDNPFASATATMKGLYHSFIVLCRLVLGIFGLVTIFFITKSMLEGDKDSMKKFLNWVIWLAVGFTMFSVLMRIF